MKYIIFINLLFLISLIILNNNNQEIIRGEIIHGIVQNDSWEIGKFYEYYINISNYELNEENILEIYGINYEINSSDIRLYLLFTDIDDDEFIKNDSIKPNITEDIYNLELNNKKIDSLTKKHYLFIPFKKISSSHNFLIILIENINYDQFQTSIYISRRIPTINIE